MIPITGFVNIHALAIHFAFPSTLEIPEDIGNMKNFHMYFLTNRVLFPIIFPIVSNVPSNLQMAPAINNTVIVFSFHQYKFSLPFGNVEIV